MTSGGSAGNTGTLGSNSLITGARALGPILETALQRAPILHMQAGRLQKAVDRYLAYFHFKIDYQ